MRCSRRSPAFLGLVALIVVGVVGCSDDDDPAEAQAVDQRIVDGALPVSGDSMESRRWLKQQLFDLRLPLIRSCLEEKGYPDLVTTAQEDFEQFNSTYAAEFPEPERMLEAGLNPDIGPTPFQGPVAAEGEAAAPETEAYYSCTRAPATEDGGAKRANELYEAVYGQWMPVVIDHVYGAKVDEGAEAEFGQCLQDKGVPPEFASAGTASLEGGAEVARTSVDDAFREWVQQRVLSGAVSPTAVEDAQIYVECGRPLWDDRAVVLEKERESFVDQHHDQLVELADLVGAS